MRKINNRMSVGKIKFLNGKGQIAVIILMVVIAIIRYIYNLSDEYKSTDAPGIGWSIFSAINLILLYGLVKYNRNKKRSQSQAKANANSLIDKKHK